jgi:DNA-binding LacI/PurR family transcriptional regulator
MRDIAAMAGVDISTVSRALGGDQSISPETRGRIQQIAQQHGYKKRSSRARTIAYVIDRRFFLLTSHFYNRVMEGIEAEVASRGYSFQFRSLEPGHEGLDAAEMRRLGGVIVTSTFNDEVIRELRAAGLPLVLLDHYIPTEDVSCVLVDNTDGIIRGLQHLAALGHRRIAYLAGDVREIGTADRLVGYGKAVRLFGLDASPHLVVECDFTISGAYRAMKGFLDSNAPVTAVAAVNDIAAIGAMEAVKERSLRIPQDISILGFDDIDLASQVIPRLSTMHVRKRTMGRLAVRRLFRLMDGIQDEYSKVLVPPILVGRDSTGTAPGAAGAPA